MAQTVQFIAFVFAFLVGLVDELHKGGLLVGLDGGLGGKRLGGKLLGGGNSGLGWLFCVGLGYSNLSFTY